MPGVDVDEREAREELADQGQDLVGDVVAAGAADEQRGPLEAGGGRVPEGEVAHVAERLADDVEGHAELVRRAVLGPVQVAEQELPDRHVLLVLAQDRVGVGLPRHARLFDPTHPLHVPRERAAQRRVHRRVVDRHQVGDQVRLAEGQRHGCLGSPRTKRTMRCENYILLFLFFFLSFLLV